MYTDQYLRVSLAFGYVRIRYLFVIVFGIVDLDVHGVCGTGYGDF